MIEMKIGYDGNIIQVDSLQSKYRCEYTLIINNEEIDTYDSMEEVEKEIESIYNRDINNIYLNSLDYKAK